MNEAQQWSRGKHFVEVWTKFQIGVGKSSSFCIRTAKVWDPVGRLRQAPGFSWFSARDPGALRTIAVMQYPG